jgi:hypothetical protein
MTAPNIDLATQTLPHLSWCSPELAAAAHDMSLTCLPATSLYSVMFFEGWQCFHCKRMINAALKDYSMPIAPLAFGLLI